MTAFQKIIEAIRPFGYPYAPDIYRDGGADRWFTYNYAADYGVEFADDEPETVVADVQVHLFLPQKADFIRLKNRVRNALFEQGFTFPEVTVLTEADTKIRHIIFECEIEEEIADEQKGE